MQSQIPPDFLKFSKKVFVLGSKYHDRNAAKAELLQHISKIKKSTTGKKKQILEELDRFEDKIAQLVEKEKKLVSTNASAESLLDFKRKAEVLQQQLWKEMETNAMVIDGYKRKMAGLETQISAEKNEKAQLIEKNRRHIKDLKNTLGKARAELNSLKTKKRKRARK